MSALVPTTVEETRSLAVAFSKSNLLPSDLRGKESDVFVTIMAGMELGLAPMASLRCIQVIKGRPVLSADAMVAVVLGSGLCEYFVQVESTDTVATYETKRKGAPTPQRMSFTIEEAKRAGLSGDNWSKYPKAMLRARAKSALARDAFSDALAGVVEITEADEIGQPPAPVADYTAFKAVAAVMDDAIADSKAARDVRVQAFKAADTVTSTADAEFTEHVIDEAEILAAESTKALKEFIPILAGLDESPAKDRLRTAYSVRSAQLKDAKK